MAEPILTKTCYTCKTVKPLADFYRKATNSDGLGGQCKPCAAAEAKARYARNDGKAISRKRYHKAVATPEGAAKAAWDRIVGRVKNHPVYASVEIRMTRDDFLAWAIPQYEAWLRDKPGVKPSVDRKSGAGHYEVSNLELIPHETNCAKTSRAVNIDVPPEHKQCGRCKKTLPFASFKKVRPGATGTFGLYGWCIECTRDYDRERSKRRKRS